jgi:lysophospholipase L1-like esterase
MVPRVANGNELQRGIDMRSFLSSITAFLLLAIAVSDAHSETANNLTVINKGRCGQNSQIVREKFEDDVLKLNPKPDYVFIFIVATDVINDRFFKTVEEHLENMTWMIEQARKADIKPVICTSHHVVENVVYEHHPREKFGNETVNEKIDRYNAALRKYAREQKIGLADFAVAAKDAAPSDLLSDGVHLTFQGNKILAKTFFDVVASQLNGQETIVCLGDSLTFGYLNKGSGTTEGETYPALLRQLPITSPPVAKQLSEFQGANNPGKTQWRRLCPRPCRLFHR